MSKKKPFRKVHINKQEWGYRVGKQSVVIQSPSGVKFHVDCWKFHPGQSPDDFDRGQWKQTSDGMIRPSEVKAYIEEMYI
jgi:hypothetical protein